MKKRSGLERLWLVLDQWPSLPTWDSCSVNNITYLWSSKTRNMKNWRKKLRPAISLSRFYKIVCLIVTPMILTLSYCSISLLSSFQSIQFKSVWSGWPILFSKLATTLFPKLNYRNERFSEIFLINNLHKENHMPANPVKSPAHHITVSIDTESLAIMREIAQRRETTVSGLIRDLSVLSRIFRTFDQATASVCTTCGW